MICEDSLEGIFSGIYQAYELRCRPEDTVVQAGEEDNFRLFSEYIQVESSKEKTVKVSNTIIREFGQEAYLHICEALATEDRQKADAVYQTIAKGLKAPNKKVYMENYADDHVNKIYKLSLYTNNEILHLKGFLRFAELDNNVLYAKIGPKNNILTFLVPHFADRLPLENFIIYDETRSLFVVHPAGKEWFLVTGEYLRKDSYLQFSEKEAAYQELFTYFCHKIAIRERKNPKLQRQMLPLRFQEYMTEFR